MIGKVLIGLFALFILVQILRHVREVGDRVHDLKDGLYGAVYLPILWLVMIPSLVVAFLLSRQITLLQWGWLGYNVILYPLVGEGSGGGAGGGTTSGAASSLSVEPLIALAILPVFLAIFLLFNYYEEKYYRDTWKAVGIWAVMHLIMGIPLFSIIPLFALGAVLKLIYDRHGLNVAYTAHVSYNVSLILFFLIFATVLS